eukprot:14907074-Heterocapsa_arctica.AAC.1
MEVAEGEEGEEASTLQSILPGEVVLVEGAGLERPAEAVGVEPRPTKAVGVEATASRGRCPDVPEDPRWVEESA